MEDLNYEEDGAEIRIINGKKVLVLNFAHDEAAGDFIRAGRLEVRARVGDTFAEEELHKMQEAHPTMVQGELIED